jgi:outer membrane protein assembly factor BamA
LQIPFQHSSCKSSSLTSNCICTLAAAIFILLSLQTSHAQDTTQVTRTDIVEIYRNRYNTGIVTPTVETNKIKVAIIPAAFSEGGSLCIITPVVTTFRLGDAATTRLSQVYFTPYFTFSNQWVFPVRSNIYWRDNKFAFSGDYRYMIYPQQAFELGVPQSPDVQSTIHYNHFRVYQTSSVQLVRNVFFGAGINYDHYSKIWEEKQQPDSSDYIKYVDKPYERYTSSGLVVEFKVDKRSNEMNPQSGMFLNNILRFNGQWMGSTSDWASIYTDFRKYISLQPRKERVMAFWSYYWTLLYGKPHYIDLPSIGWDRFGYSGRGILKNRYRSNALLYFEAEYRTNISKNGLWGAVAFASLTAPSEMDTQNFRKAYPAIGTGLRLKWDKARMTNLTFDIAASQYYWSVYFGIAERF